MDYEKKHWLNLYKENNYQKHFIDFCIFLETVQKKYKYCSNEELKEISKIYKTFWEKTMSLCKIFLWNNLIFTQKPRETITYLLSTGSIINAKKLYFLLNTMESKNDIIPRKYFNNSYINSINELNQFFKARAILESKYVLER